MRARRSCLSVPGIDRATSIFDQLEQATDGRGAARHDGEMIDEAGRRLASALVVRGNAAGLSRR
jgi:citrate lyase beta subunit